MHIASAGRRRDESPASLTHCYSSGYVRRSARCPSLARVLSYRLLMKVAIPTWSGKVSPVFDVANRLLLVNFAGDAEPERAEATIEATGLIARTRRLTQLAVDVLICGGISRPLEELLASAGIRVIPFTCGPVEDVLRAFVSGRLTDEAFLMPGCYGRSSDCRRGTRQGRRGQDGKGQGGRRPGGGERRGRGQGSRGQRRGGGHRGRSN